jgi:hypothetical protein
MNRKTIKKETYCIKKYPCWYIKKFPTSQNPPLASVTKKCGTQSESGTEG